MEKHNYIVKVLLLVSIKIKENRVFKIEDFGKQLFEWFDIEEIKIKASQ